jgi:hypothetical protein
MEERSSVPFNSATETEHCSSGPFEMLPDTYPWQFNAMDAPVCEGFAGKYANGNRNDG